MNKTGFTLIELLAVIVILAIIALIATPIVINIINDSKKEAINRSIELYLDHAQKMIAKEQMKDPTFNPSECDINEGNLICDGKPIQIEMKGQTPKTGKIKFFKGMVIEGVNLELDNLYYQVKDDNISKGTKEKVISYSDYITLKEDTGATGLSIGDKYDYEVKPETTHTFYVLSVDGDKVNLIMDRNICTNGEPATEGNPCLSAWHAGENNNNYGPDTAMSNLYQATKSWTNVPDMIMTYEDENNNGTNNGYTGITTDTTTKVTTITGKQNKTSTNQTFGNTTEPLKARLPREDEVTSQEAGCVEYTSETCSTWLVENLANAGCIKYSTVPKTGNIYGYWLLSSSPGISYSARYVGYFGGVSYAGTSNTSNYGVRAVIIVSMSDLSN